MDDFEINLESAKGKPVAMSSETGPISSLQNEAIKADIA